MRMLSGVALFALGSALVLTPVEGRAPTSLLPPGFSNEPAPQDPTPAPSQPNGNTNTGGNRPGGSSLQLDLPGVDPSNLADLVADNAAEDELTPEELAEQQRKYDLPDSARRSLDKIGPLTPATGGLSEDAFGQQSGKFLAALMRNTKAPLVSRWGSILLRRTLLSATKTPGDIDGADWAAERAWLLVRMGEADPARMMVQSVDANRYSDRLYAVAMQAYLASADPVGLCSLYIGAKAVSKSPSWTMAEAICASFSAEQGRASAILNQAQRRGDVRGIDYRLSEKIVGAGVDSRRSVKIEWDGVDTLTAWRFGLATTANVDIPPPLLTRAGYHVQAWRARAPMLTLEERLPSVQTAARLGVLSSAALVDFYAELYAADTVPATFSDRMSAIRAAYSGSTVTARMDGLRDLMERDGARNLVDLLAVSRAMAVLPVVDVEGADLTYLIAAMLSAGYDRSAMRWSSARDALSQSEGADGWAMLAVGAPDMPFSLDGERLQQYASDTGRKGELLVAGLAGLGRLRGDALKQALDGAGISLSAQTKWEKSISNAGKRREKGTVALLAAVGMQVANWDAMPPEHLYHIVSALRQAGLDAEARMIAAEAIMRS